MSMHDAFLRSIIETPDDDTPRLIYADWLEDHDDPARAEFIRVQCSLAQMPGEHPGRPALREREKVLLDEFGWAWAEHLGFEVTGWAYRRGFIECVEMCLETSRSAILAVLQKAPIRHIRDLSQFCDLSGVVEALPDLSRLTGLEFWCLYAFEDALLAQILASPHLANLRALILHHDRNGNLADEKVIVEAMHSPHRSKLRELAVNVDGMWQGPSRNILKAIATSPYLRRLRSLDLCNAGDEGNQPQMDLETTVALGRSPNLAGLGRLDLGMTSFPIEAWDEVLRWPWLSRLKWLRLHYARQVHPPSGMTVAELRDLPAFRQAFEGSVATVDWETEFMTPWDGSTSWQGLSWDGLEQRHLFSMWQYVRRRDYDGLLAAFRKDCCTYAGDSAAEAVDALPFHRYQSSLSNCLERAITLCGRHREAASIYLRLRPDLQWDGVFHLSPDAIPEPFKPRQGYSHGRSPAQFDAPAFPEAAEVRTRFSERKPLDPGGVLHYLLARTVAAFGRCVERQESPVPVVLSCMSAEFKL